MAFTIPIISQSSTLLLLNESLKYLQNNLEFLRSIFQFLSLSSELSAHTELSFVISHAINWFLWKMGLVDVFLNLTTHLLRKTTFGLKIIHWHSSQCDNIIYCLLLSRTIIYTSFRYMPSMKLKLREAGVQSSYPSANHISKKLITKRLKWK